MDSLGAGEPVLLGAIDLHDDAVLHGDRHGAELEAAQRVADAIEHGLGREAWLGGHGYFPGS